MPLLWLSLFFLTGVILGQYVGWPTVNWIALAIITLFFGICWKLLVRWSPDLPRLTVHLPNPDSFPASVISIPLLLFALFLGGARYQSSQPVWSDDFIAQYNDLDLDVLLQGMIIQPPDERDQYTLLTIRVDHIRLIDEENPRPTKGLLLARLPPDRKWRYGDQVALQGALETPSENEEFSYRVYLARKGIYAYIANPKITLLAQGKGGLLLGSIYRLREHAKSTLYQLFPDPEASLLIGILLGIETGIPETVKKAFQDSGTAHIVAISGFNMAIVAGLFAGVFGRLLGKRRGALAAILSITLYTVFVGAAPPVVRAAIMSGLSVFAAQVGRRGNGLNTLAIVAAVMVFFEPNILWDIGFQLSFLATLGLVLYAGPLMQLFASLAARFLPAASAKRTAELMGEYFLFTMAVLITTVPITVYYFGRLPLVTPLSNLTILPAQPAVMILGGLALLLGMLSLPLGQLASYLAWPFLIYTVRLSEFWAQFQGTVLDLGKVGLPIVICFYGLLFSFTFGGPRLISAWKIRAEGVNSLEAGRDKVKRWTQHNQKLLLTCGLLLLAILTFFVWRAALAAPDGRLHLTVLDVSPASQSGEALLIQGPTGRYVLINGGPSPSALSDALGRRIPPGHRQIDFLIVGGVEEEQLAGLPPNLDRYPPLQVLWAGPNGASRAARQIQESLASKGKPPVIAQTGQVLDLGQGAVLKVLSANERGAVLLLEWRYFRALLPMGLDVETLDMLLTRQDIAPLTALLLPGSGYAPLNPPELFKKLTPQVILLSVGPGDRRNLPDSETLRALDGYNLLRTDINGWIELVTDGEQVWVQIENNR